MADKEVVLKVGAETEDAKRKVSEVKEAVQEVKKEVEKPAQGENLSEKLAGQLDVVIKWADKTGEVLDKTRDRIEGVAYSVDDMRERISAAGDPGLTAKFEELFKGKSEEISMLAMRLGDLKWEQEAIGQESREMAAAFAEGKVSVEQVGEAMVDYAKRIQLVRSEERQIGRLTKLGEAGQGGAQELVEMADALGRYRAVVTDVGAEQGRMWEAFRATERELKNQRAALDVNAEGYATNAVQLNSQIAAQSALVEQAAAVDGKLGALMDKQAALTAKFKEGKISAEAYKDGLMKIADEAEAQRGALEKLQQKSAALEDRRAAAAAQAAERVEQARKREEAAAERAAAAEEKESQRAEAEAEKTAARAQKKAEAERILQVQMEYSTMTVHELREEISRLNAARQAASNAGDVASYEKLTRNLGAARMALRAATQARNVEKAAMVGQAAAGMQLANQINSLAQSAQNGTANIGGMTTQVLSLATALKAGLGPIGWVMLAIQGLQVAFDKFLQSKTDAVNAQLDANAAKLKELEEAYKRVAEVGKASQGQELRERKERWAQYLKEGQEELEQYREKAAADEAVAAARDERERIAADSAMKRRREEIGLALTYGNMTKAQAERELQAAEATHNAKMRQIEDEAVARRKANAEALADFMDAQSDVMEKSLRQVLGGEKTAALLEVKLPSEEDITILENRLQDVVDDEEQAELDAQRKGIQDQAAEIRQIMRALGVEVGGGYREVLAFARDLQEMSRSGAEALEGLKRQAAAQRESAAATERDAELQKLKADAAGEDLEGQRKLRDAQARREQAEKERNEYNREIAEELSKITGQYKLTGSYKEDDNRSAKQIRDCDRTILEAKERDLRDLLARTSDKATREKIQAALEDTEAAQRALADVTRKVADQEARRLKNLAPPEFHSKNRQVDRNLELLGKSYARYAKAAEKAAEAGDTKAMERAQRRMQQYATRMGRASKEQERADRMYRKDAEALEAVAEEHGKDYQHVKRAGQDKRRQEAAEARRRRRADQDAARQQRAQQQAVQPQRQGAAQVDAQEVAARSRAAMQELTAQITALTGACNGIAAAADGAAKATAGAVKTLNQKLKVLNEEVNAIREEVDA